jgi:dihydropteroate synthase
MAARPKVMGIINVTPDSFSDGGRHLDFTAALAHARRLIAEGADILDIGGESTRPGAQPVSLDTELERVIPLIEAVRAESPVPISIDTMKGAVAKAAAAAGASVWNDVTALSAPGSAALAAELGCEVVLMHMQGEPRTMQDAPHYEDVVAEVSAFLQARAQAAMASGVARERILLDPGIGFGKTAAHNLALLAHLDQLVGLGFPLLLGASRKRFIHEIDQASPEAPDRLGGSIAVALEGARSGCAILRVHDVAATVQALKVQAAIQAAG